MAQTSTNKSFFGLIGNNFKQLWNVWTSPNKNIGVSEKIGSTLLAPFMGAAGAIVGAMDGKGFTGTIKGFFMGGAEGVNNTFTKPGYGLSSQNESGQKPALSERSTSGSDSENEFELPVIRSDSNPPVKSSPQTSANKSFFGLIGDNLKQLGNVWTSPKISVTEKIGSTLLAPVMGVAGAIVGAIDGKGFTGTIKGFFMGGAQGINDTFTKPGYGLSSENESGQKPALSERSKSNYTAPESQERTLGTSPTNTMPNEEDSNSPKLRELSSSGDTEPYEDSNSTKLRDLPLVS